MVVLLLVLCYSADVIADVMQECFFASDSITLKLDPFCWLADYSEDFGCNSDIEEFKKFASDSNVYQNICSKIAPSIFGHDDVKKAVACLLFGGSRKFLKFVEKTAPIAVYTSGKGSSAAGLTASHEFYLEGGAMVLADGGVVCIDEFDKMRPEDKLLFMKPWSSKTISIAKAGITTVLNSRTSVLAAANPPSGHYDDLKTAQDNIDLQTTMLSRFDLIFIVKDIRLYSQDKLTVFFFWGCHVANDKHVDEAIRLFNNATMDAARSGINQHINRTPEMAKEIMWLYNSNLPFHEQQAETQINRRMGNGSHLSERRLIDELGRMGMNESIEISPVYLSRSHSLIDTASSSRSLLDAAAHIFPNAAAAQGPRRRQISSLNTLKMSLNQDTHFDSQETCFSNWTLFRTIPAPPCAPPAAPLKLSVQDALLELVARASKPSPAQRIRSLYLPMRHVEDEVFWEFTRNGVFLVKSAYLLQWSLISDQDLGENQARFDKWGKVWGLGLSPKRATTHLGFDFDVGVPILLGNGLGSGLQRRLRNVGCVDNALARFSGLRSLCRSGMIGGNQIGHGINRFCGAGGREGRVQLVLKKRDCEFNEYRVFVTDGAFRAGAGGGAAAWVLLNGTGQEVDGQVIALQRVFSSNGGDSCRVASSSIGVCTRTS
ncbi:hypothetical protein RHGRI_001227 [Rhododendron griersonianum]|uniref:DNA helicase n=1 Tax=Rhododendron griersonianum TaxID=479676 RepID=A0AAV6LLX5_9ERIC|nr:hypothetical protein RHGRI_001227 [Rhododendron griersonianum]